MLHLCKVAASPVPLAVATLMPFHLCAWVITSLPRSRQILRCCCTAVAKKVLTLQPQPLPSPFHMEDMSYGNNTIAGLLLSSGIPSWLSQLKKSRKSLNCSWYRVFVSQVRIISMGKHTSCKWTSFDPSRPIGKWLIGSMAGGSTSLDSSCVTWALGSAQVYIAE
jgi:hypothetical protein